MTIKKITAATLSALLAVSAGISVSAEDESKGIVILHTNDVHCDINADEDTFGYADLAAYRAKLESEGYTTLLVDAGDYSQGDVIGTVSSGEYLIQIMNMLDYDIAVPGNHEFDYGMDRFMELAEKSEFDVISSNFVKLPTNEPVLAESVIKEVDGIKLGFVGITTPATITSSTPKYFQNENGEYIYGFCSGDNGQELYDKVQAAVDVVTEQGADYVIALGHLGIGEGNAWTSDLVIANTTGIDMFIDGHSHSVIEGESYPNKNNESVILSSTGTKLSNFGAVTVDANGISAELISKEEYVYSEDLETLETNAYMKASDIIAGIEAEYEESVNQVVGKSMVELIATDPDNPDVRLVRTQETNLGDYCADAYRTITGADVGISNGGGIRANISEGDITYGMFISVHPYCNEICMTEATGQDILDALELGVSNYPDASGGFLQVSGLTYEIHSYVPSSVKVDENEAFIGVDGEYRVKNVMINGAPLDLNKTYTLATNNYIIKNGGDGYNMFMDNELILDSISLDNAALITYMNDYLGGVIGEEYAEPQGRIAIVTAPSSDDTEGVPSTGNADISVVFCIAAISAAAMLVSRRRK
ncbi:MAG: bifunctional metallophosphatase/5'-nucleotidase [Oscillospiraceae bacterium]|nr:bifunctional metallophosphatase/5'-nucleotidase [Oscillospiraceae bacterium]